jgi:hypothetical protein
MVARRRDGQGFPLEEWIGTVRGGGRAREVVHGTKRISKEPITVTRVFGPSFGRALSAWARHRLRVSALFGSWVASVAFFISHFYLKKKNLFHI